MTRGISTQAEQPVARGSGRLVIYRLGEQRFALPLTVVERVVPVAEITPLPHAPESIAGVVNYRGRVIPVVDCRRRFGMPGRDLDLDDQMIIARIARRRVALLVDHVEEMVDCEASALIPVDQILPGVEGFSGALKLRDGAIALIQDTEAPLFSGSEEQLELAMETS